MATLPLPPTTEVQITRVVKALYDAAPGNLYLNAFKEYAAENGGVVGVADGLLYEHRSKTNAELAQMIVDNLGLAKVDAANNVTDPAKSAAQNAKDFLIWQFNVAQQTGATRGQVLVDALNNLATLGSDPVFGKAAEFFNTSIAQAYSYSIDPANSTYDLAVLQQADEVTIGEGGVVVPPPVPGQTFTLTTDADTLSPTSAVPGTQTTSGDDTIRAVTANSLQSEDFIDAGAGTDTMNIADGAIVTGAVPVIRNVEIINITDATGATLDLQDSSGYKQIWVTQHTPTPPATTVTTVIDNVADLTTIFGVGASTTTGTIDINDIIASTTGSNDTLKLAVKDNNGNLATITSTVDAASIEAITIDAQGTNTSRTSTAGNNADDMIDVTAFTAIKSLTITGAGHIDVDASGSAVLKTVNASAATGRVTVDASGATVSGQTITTGSGNDTVFAGTNGSTVKTGAGNDTLIGGAGDDVLDGGVGADTMFGGVGADTFVIQTSTVEDLGFDVVLDFSNADSGGDGDLLQFVGGVAATSSNYVEVVATGDGFVTARSAAQNALNNDSNLKYVAVEENSGASTFVFFDGNGDGELNDNGADFAVQLTGVSLTEITAADIIAG